MGSNPLKKLRQTFVGAIGPKATHALEAGFVLFFIVGSSLYYPNISALFASLYGIEKVLKKIRNGKLKTKNLFSILEAIVPTSHLKDIRIQPIYFIAGGAIGTLCVYLPAVVTGKVFLPV